jgi:hypothetical protein
MVQSNTVTVVVAGTGPPPSQSITIAASPTSLPYTGGDVTISVDTSGIAGGTNMTLYVNGQAVASAPLPATGTMTFTYTVQPNTSQNPVSDSFYVESG